ncbi:glycosyltransferase family 2 protein [Pelagicoccus mobilis]|uniref:Glycosyltransferase family 2 protein n=1 Tax=Pelagicoccus mobilis TaxID=415221 RepID=A0A934RTK4_9BACT|nr:glycosyltransferase family A protein [Pelagicoccus mobilis]MBK1876632.1 glycosyltransferase family 2 protein [Pelagicoccus mobilis]
MRVSAIIPTYNRASSVLSAIKSIQRQTYDNIEIIVIDDGSTDNTESLINSLAEPNLIYKKQKNAGPSAARNLGAKIASGEILAFLDSDDNWLPTKIEEQVVLLQKVHSNVPCCICDSTSGIGARTSFQNAKISFDSNQALWLNPHEVLATRFVLFNQVVAIRKRAFIESGGFREEIRLLEDYDLAVRLAKLGPWGIVNSPLTIKDNSTDGIGVLAMKDKKAHNKAKKRVYQLLIDDIAYKTERDHRQLRRSLAKTLWESKALTALDSTRTHTKLLGRALIFMIDAISKLQQKSPYWPNAKYIPID